VTWRQTSSATPSATQLRTHRRPGIVTHETHPERGELSTPKGHFWWGPVRNEKQARNIANWAACVNIVLTMFWVFVQVANIVMNHLSYLRMAIATAMLGIGALFLLFNKSPVAAVLLFCCYSFFAVTLVIVTCIAGINPILIVACFVALSLSFLHWRAIRATLALRRLKIGKPSSIATVFD